MTAKNKKETVKKGNKNKLVSTQRYIQFSEVHDDCLILKSGGIRAIVEVSSVNFNLKSEEEQNSIIFGYQKFLNALDYPIQILIRSRKLDIDSYIESLHQKSKTQTNELLRTQMTEYVEYIKKLVEFSEIMEKKFYVVVPVNPPRAEKKTFFSQFMSFVQSEDSALSIIKRKKEFKELKKDLDDRVNVTLTGLESTGLKCRRLNTKEIIGLYYQAYNPQLSRTQKFNSTEELAFEG